MNYIIPIALFAALAGVAGLHAYWARGGLWPASSDEQLADWVVGEAYRKNMPPARVTWLVVAALLFAAFDGLALGFQFGGPIDKFVAWIGVGLIGVFALRGAAAYTPFWRAAHPSYWFTWMDKRFYGPFCILIAEGFFTLVSERF